MDNKKIVVGLDWSINSPGLCISRGEKDDFSSYSIHFNTPKKTLAKQFGSNIFGTLQSSYDNDMERFDNLSVWASSLIPDQSLVAIEGYAMMANGRVFHIGENTGIIKHQLFKRGISTIPVPPTELKKAVTGNGNATKEMMIDKFIKTTGVDIYKLFNTTNAGSPVADVVDAYWLCYYLRSNLEDDL
jgi:Holliday junction resolvasome RuvABC endonuclease subunit